MIFSVRCGKLYIAGLALVLVAAFSSGPMQGCEAAVIETSITSTSLAETTTTSSINPWPTDTTYTYPSASECIVATTDAPAGDCLLSVTAYNGDPGFVTNYCGRKNFTATETRTLTVDCGGCDRLTVTRKRGGCPMGIPHTNTPTPESKPYYLYSWECASTPEPAFPTISACTTLGA
ncbi:hypothetical protein SAMD00023353_12700130 [Rosellinia necatrix]|uniref:Secreted protein n=1 Tax=Rosellinia necatrix TaxID=77044 RepID=A0A1S8ABK7_ROSNE|nr:hypothetical protein SAMD00023353_12700130 [Rosellinia necatrix]